MGNLDERQSGILKAMGEETRLRILRLLQKETLNVNELCDILDMAQPKVSRHLSILRNVKLVKDQREGSRVYYSLSPMDGEMKWIGRYIQNLATGNHPDFARLKAVLDQRVRQSEEFAREKSHVWDRVGGQIHSSTAALLALASLAPRGITIADLGTGTGLMLPVLSTFAEKVYAVDHSPEMLEYAKQRAQHTELTNVEFVHCDLEDVDRRLPTRCDCAFLHFVMHQAARPPAILEKAADILKPGGRLVVVDYLPHQDDSVRAKYGSLWLGFDQERVERWLEDAGLQRETFQILKKTGHEERKKDSRTIFIACAVRPTS